MAEDKAPRAARRTFDWEAMETEYRAGAKTLRAIAADHGVTEGAIRKRAKAEGWERDLSEKIRRSTNAALVRSEVRKAQKNVLGERELVRAAVVTRVEIGEGQRARIHRLTILADKIIARVEKLKPEAIIDFQDARVAMDVTEKAARTVGQLVALERQAWAMDAPEAEKAGNASDELVRRLAAMADRSAS
jgi:hypothetical protein